MLRGWSPYVHPEVLNPAGTSGWGEHHLVIDALSPVRRLPGAITEVHHPGRRALDPLWPLLGEREAQRLLRS